MRLRVIYSSWGADGFEQPLAGGTHDLEDVTSDQARSIAGAAAAGAVEVLDASAAEEKLLAGHVQSQEDGEAAWQAAQDVHDAEGNVVERGAWQHGNLLDYVAVWEDRLSALLRDADPSDEEDVARVDALEVRVADARALLAGIAAPE